MLCLVRENANQISCDQIRDSAIPAKTVYEVGQMVYITNPDKSKLQAQKVGPYLIIQTHPESNTYTIQDNKGKERKLHVDLLRPCLTRDKQNQFQPKIPGNLLERYEARSQDKIPTSKVP